MVAANKPPMIEITLSIFGKTTEMIVVQITNANVIVLILNWLGFSDLKIKIDKCYFNGKKVIG